MAEYIVEEPSDRSASWRVHERVVRCRDCRHYRERINGCVEFGDESRGEYANVEPDGFCAWASRVGIEEGERMSITDELREWFKDRLFMGNGYAELTAIADRIDAEHEKAMSRAGQLLADAEKDRDYNYANWQDCKQKVLQGNITFNELNARIECLEDELSHCMDADNVPICIGDRMEWVRYKDDDPTIVRIVSGIGNGVFFAWSDEQGRYAQYEAHAYRHYHAPTVEDVLQEFASAYDRIGGSDEEHQKYLDLIAEYAKRLTLAEGEDA